MLVNNVVWDHFFVFLFFYREKFGRKSGQKQWFNQSIRVRIWILHLGNSIWERILRTPFANSSTQFGNAIQQRLWERSSEDLFVDKLLSLSLLHIVLRQSPYYVPRSRFVDKSEYKYSGALTMNKRWFLLAQRPFWIIYARIVIIFSR